MVYLWIQKKGIRKMEENTPYHVEQFKGDLTNALPNLGWETRKSRSPFGYVLLREKFDAIFSTLDDQTVELVKFHGVVYPGIYGCEVMLKCRLVNQSDELVEQRAICGFIVYLWVIADINGTYQRKQVLVTIPAYIMQEKDALKGDASDVKPIYDLGREVQPIKLPVNSIHCLEVECDLVLPKESMKILFTSKDA